MNNSKHKKITLIFLFILMTLAAIVENTKGIFIPSFKMEFGIDDNSISNMLILISASNMILTYVGGLICEKKGQKVSFLAGLATIFMSLMILSSANSFLILMLGMIGVSAGVALTAIASNTILPMIVISAQTIIMNMLHSCYGFGSSIGQSIFGTLITKGINWRSIYFVIGIIYLCILIIFTFIKVPKAHSEKTNEHITFKALITNKIVLLYIGILGLYMFSEQSIGNWFINYMKFSFNFDEQKGGVYLATFFALISIVRLFGGILVEKRGYFNVLYKLLISGAMLCIVGLYMGKNGVLIISLAGIPFAIIFPTIIITISKIFKQNSSYITGVILTSASFLVMMLNKTIGALNKVIGQNKAFFIIPICVIASALLMMYLHKCTKKSFEKDSVDEIDNDYMLENAIYN